MALAADPQLDQENYRAIRAEYTQIFNSFRTLVAGQLAGIIIISDKLFNHQDLDALLGTSFAFIIMVNLVTVIGQNWFSQAVYLSSYLFVAYEMGDAKSKENVNDRRYLWILANRAKHFAVNNSTWVDKYYAGQELQLFHMLQVIVALAIFLITNLLVVRSYDLFLSTYNWLSVVVSAVCSIVVILILVRLRKRLILKALVVLLGTVLQYFIFTTFVSPGNFYLILVEVCMIVTLSGTLIFYYQSRTLIARATAHWQKYMEKRIECDDLYLGKLETK